MQGMMPNDTNSQPRPRGRPPKDAESMLARINIRVPQAVMDAIEDIRSSRKDAPDASDIIRQLLVEALEARGKL